MNALDTPDPENAFCFGPFVLYPQQHLLFKNGEPLQLGSRALLLLVALVSRAGELLEKSELLSLVWSKVIVEECNLRAQIVTLRRALGDDGDFTYIVTVPGRGYRFVAPVTIKEMAHQEAPATKVGLGLPNIKNKVVGRDELLQTLGQELHKRRFVTLTGSGGIGKTSVALALAHELAADFPQGTTFLDLTSASEGPTVERMLSSALGVSSSHEDFLLGISESLGDSKRLLILDNCEHLLEETAKAVEAILRQAPLCCVLITSREPLHAEGEFVHDLAPLQVPVDDAGLSAEQAIAYSSIGFFIERLATHDPDFIFSDADVPATVAVCRKLDGNPLAIEIAAAHVRAFGTSYLVELLDGNFRLQMAGRRTAQPRHRTLSASLDWSYAMLSCEEQAMFRQLSIFPGTFSLAAVKAVIEVSPRKLQDPACLLESLMNKSLLIAGTSTPVKRYRLLETTRSYAAQKLAQHQETEATARRHATYTLSEQQRAAQSLDSLGTEAWLALYGPDIECVRSALGWCFSQAGDSALGVDLILMSIPLWLGLSRIDECHHWVDRGLHFSSITPRQRMLLLTISAGVMALTRGAGEKIKEAWKQVHEDAQTLGDTEHELRSLWGLWHERICSNQHREALELANRYIELSEKTGRLDRRLLGKRMRAAPLFYMADLEGAQQAIAEALSSPRLPRVHIIDTHFDQSIAARSLKAQIQLLQGHVGQALLSIDSNVEAAMALHHPATLWYTLSLSAIPTTLLVEHEKRSQHFLKLLQDSTAHHDMPIWRLFTRCFESVLLIRGNAPEEGVCCLGEALNQLRALGDGPLYSLMRSEYAQGLALLGLEQLGLEVLDETLSITAAREERWFRPELLRIKAQLLIAQGSPSLRPLAHEILNEAMSEAEAQGARFWAGRIAASLSRLASVPTPQEKTLAAQGLGHTHAPFTPVKGCGNLSRPRTAPPRIA
ncbi:winged helix-turn-helix domain-containing protein [Pseudomonas sp. X10]